MLTAELINKATEQPIKPKRYVNQGRNIIYKNILTRENTAINFEFPMPKMTRLGTVVELAIKLLILIIERIIHDLSAKSSPIHTVKIGLEKKAMNRKAGIAIPANTLVAFTYDSLIFSILL